jgi:hypothetical protein
VTTTSKIAEHNDPRHVLDQGPEDITTGADPNSTTTEAAPTTSALKLTAWCPDECDEGGSRAYDGITLGEIAEQHAEWMHGQGDPQEKYNIRVRATRGDQVREWDVTVDVDVEVSFRASNAFPVRPRREAEEPTLDAAKPEDAS